MHISFEVAGNQNHILFSYYFDLIKNKRTFFHPKHDIGKVILHTRSDSKNFNIFSFDEFGLLENRLEIPKESGYITYPNDASFFLWYPRLGSQVKIYNDSGYLLWKINESRYLKVAEQGQYIMAFSGDGSRIEFLRPDMSSIVAVEGFLLHSYELSERARLYAPYQACVGFLNGDIGLVNLQKMIVNRLSLKKPLRALHCDFENNYLIAQVGSLYSSHVQEGNKRELQNLNDKLIKISFDSLTFDENKITGLYNPEFEVDLGQRFAVSVPITSLQGYVVTVLPIESNKFSIQVFDTRGNRHSSYEWPDEASILLDLETFRINKAKKILVVSSESAFILLNENGIVHKQKLSKIQRVLLKEDSLSVQTGDGILSFKL